MKLIFNRKAMVLLQTEIENVLNSVATSDPGLEKKAIVELAIKTYERLYGNVSKNVIVDRSNKDMIPTEALLFCAETLLQVL
jgi:hypothetical protein